MSVTKEPIKKTEAVIQYYKEGYSQKDIKKLLNISRLDIKNILSESGFQTSDYRSISPKTKKIIELLIYEKYSYRLISEILDISFHVIRELKQVRSLDFSATNYFSLNTCFHNDLYEEFIKRYKSGESFLLLFDSFNIEMQDVLPLADLILQTDSLEIHAEEMQKRINRMLDDGYPTHMIAKKMRISVAVVKSVKKKKEGVQNKTILQ